jgi:hypothetical protein
MLSDKVVGADRGPALVALRDELCATIDDARAASPDGRNVAALAAQLLVVLRELEAIRVPEEGSTVDDLATRRAARRAAANVGAHAPARSNDGA